MERQTINPDWFVGRFLFWRCGEVHFQFSQDLGWWAYLLLALLVMVEGPVATLAGAVAASAGYMEPILVFVAAASGNLLSDTLWYTLGYLGRMEWIHRYGGYVGLREDLVRRMMHDIEHHAPRFLFVAKLTLGFTIPALVATGLARVRVRRWFPLLLLGETIWTGTLVVLGYYFGHYVKRLERGIEVVALVGALIFVAALLVYLAQYRKRAEKAALATESAGETTERGSFLNLDDLENADLEEDNVR
jgi:membrane protein DedA with SNARE-associated domain